MITLNKFLESQTSRLDHDYNIKRFLSKISYRL